MKQNIKLVLGLLVVLISICVERFVFDGNMTTVAKLISFAVFAVLIFLIFGVDYNSKPKPEVDKIPTRTDGVRNDLQESMSKDEARQKQYLSYEMK